MKKLLTLCLIPLFMWGCASKNSPPEISAPVSALPIVPLMPDTTPDMLTSGYWIGKTTYPDHLLMAPEKIKQFNTGIAEAHGIITVSGYDSSKDGAFIRNSILTLYNAVFSQQLYRVDGQRIPREMFEELLDKCNLNRLHPDSNPIKFAVITQNVSHRVLPTQEIFVRKNATGYFDRLQMSSLETGEAVAILWQSADGQWLYVRSALTVGWIPAHTAALCQREDLLKWESPDSFAVSIQYKVSLYEDSLLTRYSGWLPLGVRLPLVGENETLYKLLVPVRGLGGRLVEKTVYGEYTSFHKGYMPYTSRTMLNLAFEMLNAPYGWGGMSGEQDCSGYIIRLFQAVGIVLPRNSSQQGNSGHILFSKSTVDYVTADWAARRYGIPGATLIQFPGHIMLYIGEEREKPYVIHAIWSYEALQGGERALQLPARVVVSDLNLSAHTANGPYWQRIANVRSIIQR